MVVGSIQRNELKGYLRRLIEALIACGRCVDGVGGGGYIGITWDQIDSLLITTKIVIITEPNWRDIVGHFCCHYAVLVI